MARLLNLVLIVVVFASPMIGVVHAQDDENPRLRQLIEDMSVDERIGQLFLVTYMGDDVGPDSDIARLIQEFKVGGVVLSPYNGNFKNAEGAPARVAQLSVQLQSMALTSAGSRIPLFVALEADGNGSPTTWLRNGMTAVPSPLALGATWNPEHARSIGQIVGRELSAMGVNLLLGPPLDVILTPRPGQPGDLKTRSFGGSPYWVGKLGQAYIQGVHEGSEGQIATVAKHFPGHGSSDRSPDQEAATVEKSLEEMVRSDLIPFLRVTNTSTEEPAGLTDALMTSHLRYRGFQGPTRPGSPPISFDPGGLKVVLDLSQLQSWRETGVLVSDSLGVPAVRRHFSPSLESFPHKEIAQKALLAGNDLLLVSRFALQDDDWPAQFDNVTSAIGFFREKYESDDTFQARVDDALARILRLKMKLYPDFGTDSVLVETDKVDNLVGQDEARRQVATSAQDAVKVVAPGLQELADRLPTGPRSGDSILIFTDARQASDCPACESFQLIPETAIQDTMLRFYGPDATQQIEPGDINSFSYRDLKAYLVPATDEDGESSAADAPELPAEKQTRIEGLLTNADWIIFAMQDIDPEDTPASDALRILLKERASSLTDKKVIVLAFGAPYYLDATEISKLTAYYAIFSKVPASIEAAVRALFQGGFVPTRALPVSVPGITYELNTQLEPAPSQALTVSRVDGQETTVNVGEELWIETSTIVDRNSHPVPDGTKVTFWLTDPTDSTYLNFKEVKTVNAVAETTLLAERAGPVEIRAEAGEAQTAEPLSLTIRSSEAQVAPTATSEPPTPTDLPPTATPTITSTPETTPELPAPAAPVGWINLTLSMIGMLIAGVAAVSVDHRRHQALAQTLRLFLLSLTAGLVGYLVVGFEWIQIQKLPGLAALPPPWRTPLLSTLFALVPLLWAVGSRRQRKR